MEPSKQGAFKGPLSKSPNLVLKYLPRLFTPPYTTIGGGYFNNSCIFCRAPLQESSSLTPQQTSLRHSLRTTLVAAVNSTLFMDLNRTNSSGGEINDFFLCPEDSPCFDTALELLNLYNQFQDLLKVFNKARKNVVGKVVETFLLANKDNPSFNVYSVGEIVQSWCSKIELKEEEDQVEIKVEVEDYQDIEDNSFIIVPDHLIEEKEVETLKQEIVFEYGFQEEEFDNSNDPLDDDTDDYVPPPYDDVKTRKVTRRSKRAKKTPKKLSPAPPIKQHVYENAEEDYSDTDTEWFAGEEKESSESDAAVKQEEEESDQEFSPSKPKKKKRSHPKLSKSLRPKPVPRTKADPNAPKPKRIRKPLVPVQCKVCLKWIACQSNLNLHMRTHTGEKPFKCELCPFAGYKPSNLKIHVRTVHGDGSENTHICDVCSKGFPERNRLKVHKATAHKLFDSDSIYVCEECGEQFAVPSYLKHHIEKMHIKTATPTSMSCSICDIKFQTKFEHKLHLETKEHQEKSSKITVGARRKKKLKGNDGENPLKNQIDAARIARTCTICDLIFSSVILKRKHERISHPEIRNHMCEICGKSYCDSQSLKHHQQSAAHVEELKYKCSQCDKRFQHPSYRKLHEARIHSTAEFPHKCSQCDEAFMEAIRLRKHLLKNHKQFYLKDTPFVCEKICFFKFQTEEELASHMTKHEEQMKCKICNKWYLSHQHLLRHSVIHTGAKPFKCKYCGKSFTQDSNLREHIMRHTGERPYTCDRCSSGFLRKKELAKHMLKCGSKSSSDDEDDEPRKKRKPSTTGRSKVAAISSEEFLTIEDQIVDLYQE